MASIMACGLKASKKAMDSRGSDKHLSKVVELNGNYRIFFRQLPLEAGGRLGEDGMLYDADGEVIDKDLAVAMVPGYVLDFDVCNASFFAFSEGQFETDQYNQVIDTTGLSAWCRIASVLFDAQCAREKKNAEAEAQRVAQDMQQPVDQLALAKTLEAIEFTYHGGKAADGTPIYAKKNPIISSNVKTKITTQVAVVKLLPNGAPDWQNAQYAVWEMSKTKLDEIIAIASDKNFYQPNKEYLEVGYNYIGADKKAAGKAAKFQGIVPAMSLEMTFPTEWNAAGKRFIDGLVTAETVAEAGERVVARNRNLKSGKTPNDIITSIKQWCAKNAAVFASIDFTNDFTKRAASAFLEAHIVDSVPMVKEKFEAIVAEEAEKKNNSGNNAGENTSAATEATSAVDEAEAKAQETLNSAAQMVSEGAGQSLKALAQGGAAIDISSEDDLDLGDL